MAGLLVYLAALVLVGHGLAHLLGTAVYLELAEIADLPYETTLLGGTVDVGDAGIRLFGVLWAVAAVGFVVSAGAMLVEWDGWRALLLGVTLFSLVLTVVDWSVAYTGVVVNLGILVVLVVGPRV